MDSFESTVTEDHQNTHSNTNNNSDHGWQKVTYAKRQRKKKPAADSAVGAAAANEISASSADKANVFRSLELQSEDRHRRIQESQRAANAAAAADSDVRSRPRNRRSDDDEDEDDYSNGAKEGEKAEEEKKVKKEKKPKKPKVTVAEAATKIDASDLAAFLADVSSSYEGQQEIQLKRFADYLGRAFSGVSSAQFPWVKMFRENTIAKLVDVPVSHVSDSVYKTSVDWINQRSTPALGSFVLWSLDAILLDLANQQPSSKGSKKVAQQASSKSQVAIFVALAMVLRRKPDALVSVLPTLRETSKNQGQGQDKLPVIAWMIAQASQGDLAVGLYSWTQNLLPLVTAKSSNPQSRDIILQLVEKILSAPKARPILVNGAVRKGERLIPPPALEILLRVTFPISSARVKATERFEALYPTLKEVALAGASGSKAMKQVAQQILSFAFKAAGESNPELSKEAAGICIWCFTQSAECYKQWEKVYQDNLEASIAVLKKLSDEWKELSFKLAPVDPLRETLKKFRQTNERALESGVDDARQSLLKDADKYCKIILGKLSRGHGCLKGMAFAVVALAVGAAVMSQGLESWESWDLEKLSVLVKSHLPS